MMIKLNKTKNPKIRKIIATIIFLIILIKVFLFVTDLFRYSHERLRIVGVKEEPLDMVYIGGSTTFVYWEPLKAWNDCGFTSYNLAFSNIQAESIKYHVKQALKYQKDALFVIDARPFQYYGKGGIESALRVSSDSLDSSIDRLKLLREYTKKRDFSEDIDELSFYLDIIKYHANYEMLARNWNYKNMGGSAQNKNFDFRVGYEYLDSPSDMQTGEQCELLDEDLSTLHDLLDFCQDKKLHVLFVVCPYQIVKEDWEKYNTIEDIVKSYGFDFLNTNEYYNEMGIDFLQISIMLTMLTVMAQKSILNFWKII